MMNFQNTFQSTPSVWRVTSCPTRHALGFWNFNPHPPCGGWQYENRPKSKFDPFQSTPSVWRVTWWNWAESGGRTLYFNPHPPCGGWRQQQDILARNGEFQSTPSVWRVTEHHLLGDVDDLYFNPHPPCGGWRKRVYNQPCRRQFQSTPSVWRVTAHHRGEVMPTYISIHTLRVEGDAYRNYQARWKK